MLGQTRFIRALRQLDEDGVLDEVILLSAASLRILGVRVRTYFIDLLVQRRYYERKMAEENFVASYDLAPVPTKFGNFPVRLGTVRGDLCSFRHLVAPYNVYVEVAFTLNRQQRLIKIRPHEYVRKDCDEAINRMIQRFDERYWDELYSYHKQIEAIDLGLSRHELKFGPQKALTFEA
jgi:hypothetical protein